MNELYLTFDMETYHKEIPLKGNFDQYKEYADPITIHFQKVDIITGFPKGPFTILKKWENPDLLELFAQRLRSSRQFKLVLIGVNPKEFDLPILKNAFKRAKIKIDYPFDNPFALDLRTIRILQNKGRFDKDWLVMGSDNHLGDKIKIWYETEQYQKIVDYVEEEQRQFLSWFQEILKYLPRPLG